jgi:DNA polymerase-3 subunit delta
MRITTDQLERHLQQGMRPLYTVFGPEMLLALEAVDAIRAAARAAGFSERKVLVTGSGDFEWPALSAQSRALSLFAERRVLELQISNGKPGTDGAAALVRYCAALPDDVVTLIVLPAVERRAQKSAWFEALEHGGVAVEARTVTRAALPQWIGKRLATQQQTADEATLNFITDCVEGNLLAAHQEVQKLGLLFAAGPLDAGKVRNAVLDVARYDVFDLRHTLLTGNVVRLARSLDGLRGEGVQPPLVLWAMVDEIRAIARITRGLAEGIALDRLLAAARIWEPAHKNLMQRHVRRFGAVQAEAALAHAAHIDRMIKGVERGDTWDELLQLGLRFAASPGGRTATAAAHPARH